MRCGGRTRERPPAESPRSRGRTLGSSRPATEPPGERADAFPRCPSPGCALSSPPALPRRTQGTATDRRRRRGLQGSTMNDCAVNDRSGPVMHVTMKVQSRAWSTGSEKFVIAALYLPRPLRTSASSAVQAFVVRQAEPASRSPELLPQRRPHRAPVRPHGARPLDVAQQPDPGPRRRPHIDR